MPQVAEAVGLSTHKKLFIFDTHPIQYRSPVFRSLFQRLPQLKVFFLGEGFDGKKWWFHEVGKIPKQNWELNTLKTDYPNEVIGTNQKGALQFALRARELLAREKPDAVLMYGYYLPQHWILWTLCSLLRIPLLFVGETFSRGGKGIRRIPKNMLQPLFFKGVDQFVSIGKRNSDFYRSFGIADPKITQAKYCVDTDFFQLSESKAKETRARIRRELNIEPDAFVLLFVGRLFERKRPWDMFAIHDRLKKHPKVHTILIGNGPLEGELKATAPKDGRVHLVGFKNQGETRDFYHASDLLVVPSEYETWGLVVNEAFAAGTPALVTDTCGVAGDLVVNDQTGKVFPKGDTEEAGRFVRWCLQNPEKYLSLRQNAKRRVLEEFHVDQFADAIVNALELSLDRK